MTISHCGTSNSSAGGGGSSKAMFPVSCPVCIVVTALRLPDKLS